MAHALVVEDDEIIRDLVTYKLERMGLEVSCAEDGEDGLDQARAGNFDLLLLDLMMPRMSGIDVCRTLRADGDTTPIIMMTGKVLEGDIEAGFAAGADDYMTKPISIVELGSRVSRQLRRPSV